MSSFGHAILCATLTLLEWGAADKAANLGR